MTRILDRLQSKKRQFYKPKRRFIENIFHNFSSYKLSSSEEYALSFNVDQLLPDKFNKNKIRTELRTFTAMFFNMRKFYTRKVKMKWKIKLGGRVRPIQKLRYHINNKMLSTIYQTTKVLFLLSKTKVEV